MTFRSSYDCLWCGTHHEATAADDLAGWAQLCPGCVGRAGDNEFLRFRVRRALEDRAAAARKTLKSTPSGDSEPG